MCDISDEQETTGEAASAANANVKTDGRPERAERFDTTLA